MKLKRWQDTSGTIIDIPSWILITPPTGVKSDGDEYYLCPVCSGKNKLEVSRRRGLYYCHKCEIGGHFGGETDEGEDHVPGQVDRDRLDLYSPADECSTQFRYLCLRRGIPFATVQSLNPHTGPDPDYVYLPVYGSRGGEPIYFVGRLIEDDSSKLRYLNPPGSHFRQRRNNIVWGIHRHKTGQPRLVICEGILDACWGEDRVATLGKKVSSAQLEIICGVEPQAITVMPDGDAYRDGVEIAERLEELFCGPISVARLPEGTDPGDLGVRGEDYLANAERIV